MPGLASRATAACALSGLLLCLVASASISAAAPEHTTSALRWACPREPVPPGYRLETEPTPMGEVEIYGVPCPVVTLPLGASVVRQRWCLPTGCNPWTGECHSLDCAQPWSEPALVVRHGCPTDSTGDGYTGPGDFFALSLAFGACP